LKRAQERITRRKPIARTKDSEMMVLRPAAILGNEKGTLVVLRGVVLDQAGWNESFCAVCRRIKRFCMRARKNTLSISSISRVIVMRRSLFRFEMEL